MFLYTKRIDPNPDGFAYADSTILGSTLLGIYTDGGQDRAQFSSPSGMGQSGRWKFQGGNGAYEDLGEVDPRVPDAGGPVSGGAPTPGGPVTPDG